MAKTKPGSKKATSINLTKDLLALATKQAKGINTSLSVAIKVAKPSQVAEAKLNKELAAINAKIEKTQNAIDKKPTAANKKALAALSKKLNTTSKALSKESSKYEKLADEVEKYTALANDANSIINMLKDFEQGKSASISVAKPKAKKPPTKKTKVKVNVTKKAA